MFTPNTSWIFFARWDIHSKLMRRRESSVSSKKKTLGNAWVGIIELFKLICALLRWGSQSACRLSHWRARMWQGFVLDAQNNSMERKKTIIGVTAHSELYLRRASLLTVIASLCWTRQITVCTKHRDALADSVKKRRSDLLSSDLA